MSVRWGFPEDYKGSPINGDMAMIIHHSLRAIESFELTVENYDRWFDAVIQDNIMWVCWGNDPDDLDKDTAKVADAPVEIIDRLRVQMREYIGFWYHY